jgi:hypothetical protein
VKREVPARADFSALAADPIASAIDGRRFLGSTKAWIARVHSVYRDERSCWVQVSKDDDATASILLRCSARARPADIRATLARWTAGPTLSLRVLRVMSAV